MWFLFVRGKNVINCALTPTFEWDDKWKDESQKMLKMRGTLEGRDWFRENEALGISSREVMDHLKHLGKIVGLIQMGMKII